MRDRYIDFKDGIIIFKRSKNKIGILSILSDIYDFGSSKDWSN